MLLAIFHGDPHKADALALAAATTPLVALLTGWTTPLLALGALMALDMLTGVIAAAINGQLNGDAAYRGGLKKVLAILGVLMAVVLDILLMAGIDAVLKGTGEAGGLDGLLSGAVRAAGFRTVTTLYFCWGESLSIVENLSRGGVTMPGVVARFLKGAKQASD